MSSRKSAVWLLAGNALFLLVHFAASVAVARVLSPDEMGVYAIAMAATWVLHALQNLGLSAFVVRERELPRKKLGTVITICIVQGLLLAGAFWLLAPRLADLVGDPRVSDALRVLCAYALVLPLKGVLVGLFQRQLRLDRLTLMSMVEVGVSSTIAVVGAYAGLSYTALVWGAVIGLGSSMLLAIWWLGAELRVPLTLAHWREAWSFGGVMLLTTMISNVSTRAPELVIGRSAGVAAVGLFNRGAGLVQMLGGPIVTSAQRLFQPLLARSRDREGSMRDAYLRSVSIMTGLMWPALAGLAVLAAPTITLLYGSKWASAAPVLSLLAFAMMIDLALWGRSDVLITAGQEQRLSRLEIISCVIGLALLAGSVQFGLVGAAASRVPFMLLTVLIYAAPVARAVDCKVGEIVQAAASSLALALAAAAPAAMLMSWYGWPEQLSILQIIGLVASGIACWLAAVFIIRHELRFEIEQYARVAHLYLKGGNRAAGLS